MVQILCNTHTNISRLQRRTFTPEFILQLARLYKKGKSRSDIVREYDITPSALDRWIKNHKETGSLKTSDNRSEEENKLDELIKSINKKNVH